MIIRRSLLKTASLSDDGWQSTDCIAGNQSTACIHRLPLLLSQSKSDQCSKKSCMPNKNHINKAVTPAQKTWIGPLSGHKEKEEEEERDRRIR